MDFLGIAVAKGASDLHISVGAAPAYRIEGKLLLEGAPLTPLDTESFGQSLMTKEQWESYLAHGESDFTYAAGGRRFRVNVYQQRGRVSVAVRIIPRDAPVLADLELPEIVAQLVGRPHGLVLVTGPTGSGKSTTLAALVNHLNESQGCHIITLEDPVEYVHQHKRAVVDQREVGVDTPSFARGLRAALRQDPDVILVGEMRDLETIQTVMTAAETGHLVLATLHTRNAVETVNRIIDVYPATQQNQIRIQLSLVLQGVVAQHLVPRLDGNGRIAAVEVLLNIPAVANLIRTGKVQQLRSVLQTGAPFGMQTLEMHLEQLQGQSKISHLTYAKQPK